MALERLSNSLTRLWLAVAATVALLIVAPQAMAQQQQGWKVCNQTSFVIETATGRPEGAAVVVEGWTRLRPGECRIALAAPLQPAVHYLYARSSKAHRGGQRAWAGDVSLCVDTSGSFSVENPSSCAAMGLDSRNFVAVNITSRTNWTNVLSETELYNRKKAEAAGLQRLLNDAGVDDARIDGYIGRRTRGAIGQFLKVNDLPANTSDAELIDILEEVARIRSRDVGMTLCNRTTNRIWTSIGRRRGDGWESRGWWAIAAGECARAIDDSLIATPHFIFAEMETQDGLRSLLNANETFCIARSKFAVIGREGCEVRAYREADFVETETPQDGKLIVEFFDRDFIPLDPDS